MAIKTIPRENTLLVEYNKNANGTKTVGFTTTARRVLEQSNHRINNMNSDDNRQFNLNIIILY